MLQLYDDGHGSRLEDWLPYVPEGRVVQRWATLGKEVVELYEAQSFLPWRYGVYFNTHITISAGLLGITDHREFAKLIPVWNKELRRWLSVDERAPRCRSSRRALGRRMQEHHYIYVLEWSARSGLHLHQLCVVPRGSRKAFGEHTRAWWGHKVWWTVPAEAVHVRHELGAERTRRCAHQRWFRYLIKSMNRELGYRLDDGSVLSVASVLKPCHATGVKKAVYAPQLYGVSRSLSKKARAQPVFRGKRRDIFVSDLSRGRFDDVYSGWEIEAFEFRSSLLGSLDF